MKPNARLNEMQMQGGHLKYMCLDLDLRSIKSGSHAM